MCSSDLVQMRRLNARLLLEEDDKTGMEVLPILKVVHATGKDAGLPRADETFIPPCLVLRAWRGLVSKPRGGTWTTTSDEGDNRGPPPSGCGAGGCGKWPLPSPRCAFGRVSPQFLVRPFSQNSLAPAPRVLRRRRPLSLAINERMVVRGPCQTETRKEGRMIKGVLTGAVLLLLAVVVLQSLPDFQRYVQLRDM